MYMNLVYKYDPMMLTVKLVNEISISFSSWCTKNNARDKIISVVFIISKHMGTRFALCNRQSHKIRLL